MSVRSPGTAERSILKFKIMQTRLAFPIMAAALFLIPAFSHARNSLPAENPPGDEKRNDETKEIKAPKTNTGAVYEMAAASVVYIAAFIDETAGRCGAGFVADESGLILTSLSLVWDESRKKPAGRMLVFLKPETLTGNGQDDLKRRYDAVLVAEAPRLDLALLRLNKKDSGPKPLSFAEKKEFTPGSFAISIGHPDGGRRWSPARVRLLERIENFNGEKGLSAFKLDPQVARGFAGAPLLDGEGGVLGVVSRAPGSEKGSKTRRIGWAIDGRAVHAWLKSLKIESGGKSPEEKGGK